MRGWEGGVGGREVQQTHKLLAYDNLSPETEEARQINHCERFGDLEDVGPRNKQVRGWCKQRYSLSYATTTQYFSRTANRERERT